MNIKINDTLRLSDGKTYTVCSNIIYEEEMYIYLVDLEDYKNQKLLKLNKETDKLVNVTDTNLIEKIAPLLLKKGIKNVKENFINQE